MQNGNFINHFDSIISGSKETGVPIQSISNSCRKKGLALTRNTYRWTYEYDEIDKSKIKIPDNQKPVTQYDLQGNIIKKWNSIIEASKELNISCNNINACCNNKYCRPGNNIYKGYKWMFLEDYEKII